MVLIAFGDLKQNEITPITIPDIPEDVYEYLGSLPKEICRILLPVLHHRPDSEVYAFRTETGAFAAWVQKEAERTCANCNRDFGSLQLVEQGHSWTAWAVIAAKLLSIAQCDTDMGAFVDLSGQYLLNDVPTHKSMKLKKHKVCCKLNTVAAGIEYGLKFGIPKNQDWEFKGCENTTLKKDLPCLKVMGRAASLTLQQALVYLQKQPVAAKLHQFANFDDDKIDVYRGPTCEDDEYVGTEDVMVYETKLMGEEWVAVVVIPSTDLGYVNVSLDVMVIYASRDSDEFGLDVGNIDRRTLSTPGRLLTEFVAVGPRED